MIVEVIGVFYRNKGAMLMLEAIREKLAAALPEAKIAVPATMPRAVREKLGLLATPARDARRFDLTRFKALLPGGLGEGVISPDDVDVILDASGFGYGDYWGLPKMHRRLNRLLKRYPRPGHAAILLPQALGPFEKPGMMAGFRSAARKLDLLFVRDKASWNHVHAALGDDPKLRRAPDFTNLLHPSLAERLADWRGFSFVIPNQKMVAGVSDEQRRHYIDFLMQAVVAITATGRKAAILIHEGEGDRDLAVEVNAVLSVPVPVVDEESALSTKALIGAADVVISSRFHGLVSALSAAVPALACGWSHKYAELMEDYGCGQHLARLDQPDSWRQAFAALLDDADDLAFRTALQATAARERQRSEAMWDEVITTIKARIR